MSNALTAEKNTLPIPVITDDLNSYLAKIASGANDAELREAAQALLN